MTLLEQPTTGSAANDVAVWVDICALEDLLVDRGVCALVAGEAVAVFRCLPDHALFAVGNIDPYSGSSVMSRGIVGSIAGRPMVASPLFKQRFDLATGLALDDPDTALSVYPVRVVDGTVQVGAQPTSALASTRGDGS